MSIAAESAPRASFNTAALILLPHFVAPVTTIYCYQSSFFSIQIVESVIVLYNNCERHPSELCISSVRDATNIFANITFILLFFRVNCRRYFMSR